MGLVGHGLPSAAVDGGVVAAGDAAGVALEVREEAPLGSGMSKGVRRGWQEGITSSWHPFSLQPILTTSLATGSLMVQKGLEPPST